jgi:hypothetical protein
MTRADRSAPFCREAARPTRTHLHVAAISRAAPQGGGGTRHDRQAPRRSAHLSTGRGAHRRDRKGQRDHGGGATDASRYTGRRSGCGAVAARLRKYSVTLDREVRPRSSLPAACRARMEAPLQRLILKSAVTRAGEPAGCSIDRHAREPHPQACTHQGVSRTIVPIALVAVGVSPIPAEVGSRPYRYETNGSNGDDRTERHAGDDGTVVGPCYPGPAIPVGPSGKACRPTPGRGPAPTRSAPPAWISVRTGTGTYWSWSSAPMGSAVRPGAIASDLGPFDEPLLGKKSLVCVHRRRNVG